MIPLRQVQAFEGSEIRKTLMLPPCAVHQPQRDPSFRGYRCEICQHVVYTDLQQCTFDGLK